jgi:hypothetical protein
LAQSVNRRRRACKSPTREGAGRSRPARPSTGMLASASRPGGRAPPEDHKAHHRPQEHQVDQRRADQRRRVPHEGLASVACFRRSGMATTERARFP